MVDVPVQNEGVNALGLLHAVVRIGVSRRLVSFAVFTIRRVEALFGQDDSPRLAVVQESFVPKKRREHLDVFEGYFRGVKRRCCSGILPGSWVEKIFRIRMKRNVPVEVPLGFGNCV